MLSRRQRALLQERRLYAPHGVSGRTRRASTAQRNTTPDTGKEHNIYNIQEVSGSDGDSITSVSDAESSDQLNEKYPDHTAITLQTNSNGHQYLDIPQNNALDTIFDSSISQPWEVIVVGQFPDSNSDYCVVDGAARAEGYIEYRFNSNDYQIFAGGSGQTGGTPTATLDIINAYFATDQNTDDDDDASLLVDNSPVVGPTDGAGSAARSGHTISEFGDGARQSPLNFYYMVFFDSELTNSERQEWYDYLNGIYG